MFERYIDWAYTEVLAAEGTVGEGICAMVKLYLLADVLDDIKLRNKTLMALSSYASIDQTHPGAALIGYLWDRTASNSPLRRWVVDATILKLDHAVFERTITQFPAEFVQQVALKLLQQTPVATTEAFNAKLREHIEVEDNA